MNMPKRADFRIILILNRHPVAANFKARFAPKTSLLLNVKSRNSQQPTSVLAVRVEFQMAKTRRAQKC